MSRRIALAAGAAALFASGAALAQAYLDPAAIGRQPVDAWTTYHGDYSGRHYSGLSQITPRNVKTLQQVWATRMDTGRAGAQSGGDVAEPVPITLGPAARGLVKATPLFVDGVLYLSTFDHAWAIDARTGRQIWHFFWRTSGGEYTGNRGMAMYKGTLFLGTPDGNLVALDAATGKERWHKRVADFKSGYYMSVAPVVVKNHLIWGTAGDSGDIPSWVESRDPETGELQWKWNVTPGAGEPGIETWPSVAAAKNGGGQAWNSPTYDPELNLIYFGTGNPDPSYAPELRKGDNLYTCTLIAMNPDTGKMVWFFQTSPNEAWDFDSNQAPVLLDRVIGGKPRKLVAQATRNGMYFLWDRVTGEHLVSTQIADSVNWSTGFDAKGRPVRNEAKVNRQGGALISPSNGGVQNWAPPAYLPETGLLYLNAMQGLDIHYAAGPPDPSTGGLAHQAQAVGGYDLELKAVDVATGKVRWSHAYAGSEWNPPRPHQVGGLLATAGSLIFSGAPAGGPGGFLVATDPKSGRQLWHANLPTTVTNTPITYMMDGRQYVVIAADDTVYAYALPQ